MSPRVPFEALRAAILADSAYAWSWHCNVAMPLQDSGVSHEKANLAAAKFMKSVFGVDVTQFYEWKFNGCTGEAADNPERPTAEQVALYLRREAVDTFDILNREELFMAADLVDKLNPQPPPVKESASRMTAGEVVEEIYDRARCGHDAVPGSVQHHVGEALSNVAVIVADNLVPRWQPEPTHEGEHHVDGIDQVCYVSDDIVWRPTWDKESESARIIEEPLNGRQVCPVSPRPGATVPPVPAEETKYVDFQSKIGGVLWVTDGYRVSVPGDWICLDGKAVCVAEGDSFGMRLILKRIS